MKSTSSANAGGLPDSEYQDSEDGLFEITVQVRGAARVNRLLSWIVRSQAYDDVEGISVAYQGDRDNLGSGSSECA